MRFQRILFLLFILFFQRINAQITFPDNGVATPQHDYHAFINARIFINAETVINKGTLLIRDGKVSAIGADVSLPKNTVVTDLKGKFIYPSFIDLYASYGMPKVKKEEKKESRPLQLNSSKKGAFNWNEMVHPEKNATTDFTIDPEMAKQLRALGFGAVLTHQHDGIFRGTSTFVTLGDQKENEEIISGNAAFQLAFKRGHSRQNYPTSLMGVIALIRQTYYDAAWYLSQEPTKREEFNVSLEAFKDVQGLPSIMDAGSCLSVLRAAKIGQEFEIDYIIKGGGDEYKRLNEIKQTNRNLIIPLNFPKAYDVSDPYEALNVSLSNMKHWEMAPANAGLLEKSDVPFAFTLDGLEKKKDFWPQLRKAMKHGLSEEEALRALTSMPAGFVKHAEQIGDLSVGKLANFLIVSGNVFDKDAVIYENWIRGKQHIIQQEEIDIRGLYNLNVAGKTYALKIEGTRVKPTAAITLKNERAKITVTHHNRNVQLSFPLQKEDSTSIVQLSGNINDDESRIWAGKAEMPDGNWVDWAAIRRNAHESKGKDTSKAKMNPLGSIWFPNKPYGFDSLPDAEIIIFENATIWTNEDTGILSNTDIAIAEGKILAIGNNLTRVGLFGDKELEVKTINVKGKHITSGIIDEHSHIAVSGGVNEAGWNTSSEVRIGDVINSDDVNIYRQLAGGVTAVQLLHGSANPIGGQSALIKLRWGKAPEEMKIEGADGFIKFALGENVKQSNWGDRHKVRFPQTRMGVEQVYYDAFTRAREYKEPWMLYANAMENKRRKEVINPPRRVLRLEALAEILDTQRFITCHSYVQSEINMLMHVADSMRFRVNTFTHVLEGYKLADKLREHGAGASTFSDWWAYKFEVNDAIPYNGAILHEQGVVTAFNSDDAEMGRRLNQEAAKAVKYGGVSEEDAWKFVTLHPAQLLHLDDRMGSLKEGKDADIVVWSHHPLSINAKVEKTFIDGICYFDRERDVELQKTIQLERARLVRKLLLAKKAGEKLQKLRLKKRKENHCDTIIDLEEWIEE